MAVPSRTERKVRPARHLGDRGASSATREGWTFSDWASAAAVVAALVLLALHIREYIFLTDDSFISFRYARNLLNGQGLVFNPGGERVEGYTNLLWVLLLAGSGLLGFDLETASIVASLAATAVLFLAVVGFVWTRLPRGSRWLAVVPALFLASTRSFAVWSTSGLETRLFELLIVTGVLRLVVELDSESRRPTLSPWLFGLAVLTRPEGALVGGSVLVAGAIWVARSTRRLPWGFIRACWPVAALVALLLAFRLAYYGDWLPNTYYAKVAGQLSWGRGARYLAAFALEYSAFLWIPALLSALLWHRREQTAHIPLVIAAAIVPHALYVAAIGGDHFEYRMVGYYLPLSFVLLVDGLQGWTTSKSRASLSAAYAGIVVFGLAWLPARSHAQFPNDYLPGFPGQFVGVIPQSEEFLDPDRDPVYRLPLLRQIGIAHRDLVRDLTRRFAGIRQEEHRLFRERAEDAARRLNRALADGWLGHDVYVALDCVGVVPYRTDLRTLDRLGLTDAHVARSPSVRAVVAHSKVATLEYARDRGVDLWSEDPVSPVVPVGSHRLEVAIRQGQEGSGNSYVADVGSGNFLFALLPQGIESARRRMPRLPLRPVGDPQIARSYVVHYLPELVDLVKQGRGTPGRVQRIGEIAILAGDHASGARIFEVATQAWPQTWQFHWMLTMCHKATGDFERATASLERASSILGASGDAAGAARLLQTYRSLPSPAAP